MQQKSIPEYVIIDRRRQKLILDGEQLPFFIHEDGPRVEDYAEGLSLLWVPILIGDYEVRT
jgi:hypothetical protein